MTRPKLYWRGNAAKTKYIDEILQGMADHSSDDVIVFDYGCGKGGDWPNVLADYPMIRLIAHDPSVKNMQAAKLRLKGLNAELLTSADLHEKEFKAHYIVSFSVLEHVYDRAAYLRTAKKHLIDDGTFYLNYDDGHFRNSLNLSQPVTWPEQIRIWLHNIAAQPLARVGGKSYFQARVHRHAIGQLISAFGFRVINTHYNNLTNFKQLDKTLTDDRQQDFMRFWMDIENDLNSRFLIDGNKTYLGDQCNLWQVMGSRTLVLKHS